MGELTLEQRKALALAAARKRAAEPQGNPEHGSMANSAMDMLTFGLQPKINAAGAGLIDATIGAVKGEGFNYSDAYNRHLQGQRADQSAYEAENPVKAGIGTGAGLAAGIATLPAAMPFKGPGMVRGMGNGAVTGGMYGAAGGAVQDADSMAERGMNTAQGAGFGATIGAAAYPVIRGIGNKLFGSKQGPVPTTADIKQQSKAAYRQAESYGVNLEPGSYSKLVDDIASDVITPGRISEKLSGVTDSLHPASKKLVESLQGTKGMQLSLEELGQVRSVASKIANQMVDGRPTPDAAMAMKILDRIDDYVTDLPSMAGTTGDATAAVAARDQASALWRRMIQSSKIDRAMYKAKLASETNYSQAGYAQAVRREFSNLAKSERFERIFDKEQQAAIRAVVKGGPIENIARYFGKMAPSGGLSQMLNLGAAFGSGGATIPITAAASGAQYGAARSTIGKAGIADALIKSGSKPNNPRLSQGKEQIMLRLMGQGIGQGKRLGAI